MSDQPEDAAVDLSDDELDAIIGTDDDSDAPSTEAPEGAPEGDTAEEAVVEPAQAPESAEAAAGDAPPASAVETRPAEEAAVPAIPAGAKPFQFKASGQVQALPGAHELPDGSVLVTKDAITELRRTFANERDLSRSFQQYRRESDRKIKEAQTQRTAKDAEADAVIAWGAELAQLPPEQLAERLLEFQGNIPRYQLDLERKRLQEQERLLEEQRKGPQLSEEEQQERFGETVQGELAATITYLEQDEAFKGLTAEDRQTLRARWEKRPELLVRRATEDMPQYGIAKGDVLFDPSNLLEDAKFILANRKPATPSPTAAARNAQLNADRQTPVNPIPPSVRNRTPTGQPRDRKGQFTNKKSYRKSILEDDDDDEAA